MVQVQTFGAGTRYGIEILHHCGKRFKLKVIKFWGLIRTFVEFKNKRFFFKLVLKKKKKKKKKRSRLTDKQLLGNISANQIKTCLFRGEATDS